MPDSELARLEAFLRTAPIAMSVIRTDGTVALANDRAAEMFGVPPGQALSVDPADFFQDPSGGEKLTRERLEDPKRERDREIRLKRADGTLITVVASSRVIVVDGEAMLISGLQDVSEARALREELLTSEQRFRTLTENASDIISVVDADGIVRYVGPSGVKLLGYGENEALGRAALDYVHAEDVAHLQELWGPLLAEPGTQLQCEFRAPHKDGRWLWVEAVLTNLAHDPAIGGVVVNCRGITERKAAEAELQASEQRFRALIENTGEIIYTVRAGDDPAAGDIDFVSPSVEDILGYSPEEFFADPGLWSRIVHPDDMEAVRETTIALEQRGGNATRLYRLRHKTTGEYCWMEDHVTFRPSGLHGGVTLQGAARDVTRRKRAEDESSLLQSVALAVSEAADLTSGLEAVLKIVCEATGWSTGDAWTPSRDGTALECAAAWSRSDEALDDFRRHSETFTFAPGVGLPGRVWASGKPLWVPDVSKDPNCVRSARAQQAGLKSAAAVPVLAGDEVIAVMAFFLSEAREEDERFVCLVSAVAAQLGALVRRKRAEEALQRGEQRFRTLIENSSDMITLVDPEGKIVYASPSIRRELGYSDREFVGHPAADFTHPDDQGNLLDCMRRARRKPGSAVRTEARVRHKDGRWLWAEANLTSFDRGPADRGTVFNYRDITERRRLEEESNLLQSVALALAVSEADDLRSSLDALLQMVCGVTGWSVGEAWTPSRDGAALECAAAWCIGNEALDNFRRRSETFTFAPGVGLPGHVWSSGRPLWIREVTQDANFPRAQYALEAGLKAGAGIPVLAGDEVVAVIEFFMIEAREEDERLVRLISAVAAQLGPLIQRKQAEDALRESEARFRSLAENSFDLILEATADGRYLYVNANFKDALGYKPEELLGTSIFEPMHADDIPAVMQEFSRAVKTNTPGRATFRYRHKDGRWLWFESVGKPFLSDAGDLRTVIISRDITERKQSEDMLRRLSSVVEQTADAVFVTDVQGTILYANPATEHVTGYTAAELVGKNPRILGAGEMPARFYKRLWETILAGRDFRAEFINRRKDGSRFYEEKVITPVRGETGEITQFVSVGRDVTERKQAEETIRHMAYHDPLTGLPNRALFMDRADVAIAQAKRSGGPLAVLFLDLDRLKLVNDTLGHDKGDELIKDVGLEVSGIIRDGDTVARMGGDEYAILLTGVVDTGAAEAVAARIVGAVKRRRTLHGQGVTITASVGIATYPDDGTDAQALLKSSDMAMYAAKERGGDGYELYSHLMGVRVRERLSLENDLRLAIESGQLEVHYQPQVSLASGAVAGVEALARWDHPERGPISPAEFIPVAEETGLIIPLQFFVISTAIDQLRDWTFEGLAQLRLGINLSAACLRLPELTANLRSVLKDRRVEPSRVQFEITESMALADPETAMSTLASVRDLGASIALDDFGTGCSSFGHLHQLPIDTIKLDISLVRDISVDPTAGAIATAILSMARELGLRVIAEGVETEEQLEALRQRGCDEYQGFLFSKALPADEVRKLLRPERRGRGRRP